MPTINKPNPGTARSPADLTVVVAVEVALAVVVPFVPIALAKVLVPPIFVPF